MSTVNKVSEARKIKEEPKNHSYPFNLASIPYASFMKIHKYSYDKGMENVGANQNDAIGSIQNSGLLKNINEKPTNLLAPLIPGRLSTYIYDDEKTYYNMYSNSIFAITNKKLGWDCLRHYEILMNGCIPLFFNIEDCPKLILKTLPKQRLSEIYFNYRSVLQLYSPFKIYKKKFLSTKKIFSYIPNMFKNKSASVFLKKNSSILAVSYTHLTLPTKRIV